MTDAGIHVFTHHAMATFFQVRLAGEEESYAGQAARAAFDLLDRLENLLSRFRENSDISAIGGLMPGEKLRVAEPTFSCLETAREMEATTGGVFSVTAAALSTQPTPPQWSLSRNDLSVRCDAGRLEFDLGAIGKGFALDRMAQELADWDCPSFLLSAGGSSVLIGAPPPGKPGWSVGLSDDTASRRFWLQHCSLSGSGVAVKGEHIFDPRSGKSARQRSRAWALTPDAARSDALSTACMVLTEKEIAACLDGRTDWLAFIWQDDEWRHYGSRPLPPVDDAG
ncbi:MAG TPA: FAD:protein FMN transferase [Verrucomicrobiae bacterium]|jgi:thiamine biosynthesis lipoprotein|nr:FAD:protein FMN transferase [Verrucomicrobiae bacterium]